MANLNLPTTPSDGQVVTHENTKFIYSSSKNVWTRQALNTRSEQIVPSSNTSLASTAITDNKLVLTQADGSTSNVSLQGLASGSLSVYANESDLPSSGIQAGDHAFVTATNDLYIRTATQWRSIDSINLTPSVSMSLSSHSFTAEGETIDVTYTTNEPEGTPVTITVANSGLVSTNEATVTHHASNNTISILAGNTAFAGGIITLSATDGVNIGTGTVNIDLSLGVSWAGETSAQLFVPGLGSNPIFVGGFDSGTVLDLSSDGLYALATGSQTANTTGGFAVWKNTSGDSSNNSSWEHYHTQVGVPFGASSNNDFESIPVGASGTNGILGEFGNFWGRNNHQTRISANGSIVIAPWFSQYNNTYRNTIKRIGMYIMDISNTSNITDHSSFNHLSLFTNVGYNAQEGFTLVNNRDTLAKYVDMDDNVNYITYTWDNWRATSSSASTYGKIMIASRSGQTWTNRAEFHAGNTSIATKAGRSLGSAQHLGYSGVCMNSTGDKVVAASPTLFKHYGNHGTYGNSTGPQGGLVTMVRSGSTWSEAANGHLWNLTGGTGGGGTTNAFSSIDMSKDGSYLAVVVGHGFNGWQPPGNVTVAQTPVGNEGVEIYAWNSVTQAWDYQTIIRPSTAASGNPTYVQADGIAAGKLNSDGSLLFMSSYASCLRIYKRTGSSWSFVTAHDASDISSNGHDFSSNNSLTGPTGHIYRGKEKAFAVDGDGRNFFYNTGGYYNNSKKGDGTTIIQST